MNREELYKIFENEDAEWEGDNALEGLNILSKYFSGQTVLQAAEHDIIYSVSIDDALDAGLTENDAKRLSIINWMLDDDNDCFACFV